MPARVRKRNEMAPQIMPLLLLGIALVSSNRYFTVINDEAWTLDAATNPVHTTLAWFQNGAGPFEHAPVYDLLLHFWLLATGGAFEYLRVPSILFFLAGLFLLGRAARRIGGAACGVAAIWVGALWPLGFHYGRLAAWNPFLFFLIAGLTHAYFRYLEDQTFDRWAVLSLFGVALLWTNYLGWTVLVFLLIDQILRRRAGDQAPSAVLIARTGALFCLAFIPVFRGVRSELASGIHVNHSALTLLSNAAFNLYTLLISESVAPWYWRLSVPGGLAVLGCLVLAFLSAPRPARRFLLYGLLILLFMAVTGTLTSKRLFLIAPWILLPIGVAVGSSAARSMRIGMALTLLIIAGIGWYGIYARNHYSDPRFVEPWLQTAGDAADKIQSGATVIANSPSFFFYLTYILRVPDSGANWKFAGALPDSVHHPRVYSAETWLASGHPISPAMTWIHGVAGSQTEKPMNDAVGELDRSCGGRTSHLTTRDQGYAWKLRFLPGFDEPQWRIEIREYDCTSAISPEILRLPTP